MGLSSTRALMMLIAVLAGAVLLLVLVDDNQTMVMAAAFVGRPFLVAAGLLGFRFRRSGPKPEPVVAQPAAPPAEVGARLSLADDPARQFAIDALPFTIGRAEGNALVIDDTFPEWQTVSASHAVIQMNPRGLVIVNQAPLSENGLRVNGRPTAMNLLEDGWRVAAGGVEFVFHLSPSGNRL